MSFLYTKVLLRSVVLISAVFDVIALDNTLLHSDVEWKRLISSAVVASRPNILTSYVQNERKAIVGGNFSTIHRFPYMVTVQYNNSGKHLHYCGGTLIAPDFVLTAAHCYTACTKGLKVIVGDHDLTNKTDGGEVFEVKDTAVHPNYDSILLMEDIMLLQLSGRSNKPTVRLNKDSSVPTDFQTVDAIGWGATDPKGKTISNILKETTLEIIPNKFCTRPNSTITFGDDIICAADLDGTADEHICFGDSGGPLFVRGSNYTEDIQIGLVSTIELDLEADNSSPCIYDELPAHYSRISYYYDWITNIVCNSSVAPPSYMKCSSTNNAASNPTSTPPAITGTNKVALTFAIKFDDSPQEISWSIYKETDEMPSRVYRSKEYSKDLRHTIAYEHLDLEADQQFAFALHNCYEDGVCCSTGDGYFSLHWGHEQENFQDKFILFNETGNYEKLFVFFFDTGNNSFPTEAPTKKPTSAAPTKLHTGKATTLCIISCLISILVF